MDAMDYDVHLFTDAETGEDAGLSGWTVGLAAGPPAPRISRMLMRLSRAAADCEFASDTGSRGRPPRTGRANMDCHSCFSPTRPPAAPLLYSSATTATSG